MTAAKQMNDRADDAQLEALGYTASFDRKMSLWGNFALGFTYLSPVVGVYTLFAFALATGGAPMFWSYLLVGIGQFLVCLVFAEIVSQYPIAGGVYPWARRLIGDRWGWMTGWVYLWALATTVAAVAMGAGPYLAALAGFEPSPFVNTVTAILIIAVSTLFNLAGTKVLARVAMMGFLCELGGALIVGAWLLAFGREQPFSVLFDTFSVTGEGSYLPAFLAAGLAGIFQYYGFEACGDVAEEVPNPSRAIPRAMRLTIYVGGAAAMFVCLALILAVKDIGAVIAGQDTDPVWTVLTTNFGETGARVVLLVVLVSFLSCVLSLQAAASRLMFSFARDGMLPASRALARLSSTHVPNVALVICGIVPAIITVGGYFLSNAVAVVVSFAAVGIYIAFQMVVFAAISARLRGWKPSGPFNLRGWGVPVTLLSFAYGVSAIINLAWPRMPDANWYENYAVLLTSAVVVAAGLFVLPFMRRAAGGPAVAGE
ncbi:APC family permease [Shinella sp. NM-101]|uniref:APC family permease n=1 Tax=Shinella sp. NM-101 TaxID=2744455 RepID=UPI001F37C6D9|nr:APC family permease [Shinella sp. NM-101]